ncbi:MAG: family 16 glycosylhydrolase [Nocardioides sp.]|nr:family 16 glycosylhydrolase [Nocardioides sp.]
MSASPLPRKLLATLTGLTLVGSAWAAAALSGPAESPQVRPAFASTCIGYCRHPTNAAKVFRWGNEAWDQEFETGSLVRNWKSNHPRRVGQQQGMLTLDATRHRGTIRTWPGNQAARYGRWEARVRAREFNTRGRHYLYTWELVPAGGNARCGRNRIILGSYRPGDRRARGTVNTLPDHSFTFSRRRDLRSRAWHTYAIEITRHRISWFVDTRVVRTERRSAALSGVKYRPEFVMKAVRGARMRRSYMQMDWVRYYTLRRPDARSIAARRMHRSTISRRC